MLQESGLTACVVVAGGNQRELAREKNQKKQGDLAKKKAGKAESMSLEQRKQRYQSLYNYS